MRIRITFILASLLIVVACNAHTLHWGRTCPEIQAFPALSLDKIMGIWYVVYQVDTSNTCLIWNLTKSDTNLEQLLLTESRQLSLLDLIGIDHKHSLTAVLDIPNPEIPSRMRIRWPTSLTGKADFIVFDTDYENYLAIFQCDRAGIVHRRDITVLSRTPIVDDMFVKRVRRLMDNADVGHGYLDKIGHRNCRKTSSRNWHTDGSSLGMIPPKGKGNIRELSKGVTDYDISEIEIIGDGVEGMAENFRGSLKKGAPIV